GGARVAGVGAGIRGGSCGAARRRVRTLAEVERALRRAAQERAAGGAVRTARVPELDAVTFLARVDPTVAAERQGATRGGGSGRGGGGRRPDGPGATPGRFRGPSRPPPRGSARGAGGGPPRPPAPRPERGSGEGGRGR